MNDLVTERTPPVIAAEINMITHQTKKILLASAVEIGCRLKEAKSLVKHGEWGKWLEESVSYSRRTADRLIQLYEEYGPSASEGESSSNWSLVTNLTYTQAVLLLGLPAEEREEFLAQNDVADMTKQELQQALKDRDQAKQEKEQALQENEVLKQGLELIDSTLSEFKKEQAKALVQPDPSENVTGEAAAAGAGSSGSNASPANNTSLPTHNLQTEVDPNAAAKYVERCNTCCKTISTTFFELTTALTNLTHLDVKLKEEKRKEAQKLLETIAETIKEWPPAKKPLKIIH
ncbi:DUF3102 domain-containing protein [Desulfitobacterium chlororespirans]|uniref:Protein export cytoplasm protein SecA ATPase RNA helicase n=1 Tax=Desulfitobacterium chlororespirans DSM 11544 TaxID=1121395 RepID=A0A1M7TVA1_9FIRM|nr:DUF3102 domain-containing protein [Desulfitobacterium chlororespirans]SHN74662.1 Protein of unknown function [Desulfitobacterium chlororespirans DSM 11544]